ncbi:MarR family transcriptional regulator [Nesterenkonia pannonica]|uniref:MarR family transcriptional regulator n=1 Tax=Nesterenkonia pannonica TaxID=1548602 RepID=UPI002164CA4D|nr:MarR family transcriptional regulator [Nesterenkonia pannonica]
MKDKETPTLQPAEAQLQQAVTNPEAASGTGYWYLRTQESYSAIDLLNLLRSYRDEETAMRARTQGSMGMKDTEMKALRFLLQQDTAGHTPAEGPRRDTGADRRLSDRPGRPARSPQLRTTSPHPEDRRSVGLKVLPAADRDVRSTLSRMHADMITAAEELTPTERVSAAKFLEKLIKPSAHTTGPPRPTRPHIETPPTMRRESAWTALSAWIGP